MALFNSDVSDASAKKSSMILSELRHFLHKSFMYTLTYFLPLLYTNLVIFNSDTSGISAKIKYGSENYCCE